MRKSLLAGGVALAAAAALSVGVVAAQATSGPAPHAPVGNRIHVVEHAITDTVTDTGTKGDSVGDLLTFANPVYGPLNKVRVGRDNGSCIRTVAGKAWECSWTTFLRGGSLVVEGPFYDTHDSMLAITGGTGRFATARGQMLLRARNAKGTEYDFVFMVRG